jgi:hypothetical protein
MTAAIADKCSRSSSTSSMSGGLRWDALFEASELPVCNPFPECTSKSPNYTISIHQALWPVTSLAQALQPALSCATCSAAGTTVSMPSMSGGASQRSRAVGCGGGSSTVSMPSVSGGALQPTSRGRHVQPFGVSMPSVSGGALQPLTTTTRTSPRASPFLCPRCRAGRCNGCLFAGLLTCAFAARCADLPGNGGTAGHFRSSRLLTSYFPCADRGGKRRSHKPLYRL